MPAPTETCLVFVLHFHQPFGNLDRVFADATDRCYERTLDLIALHPAVRVGLHVSGPLLEWLVGHRPRVVEKIRALVARGQCEVLGGGIQEPMLAILPDRDAVGQLVTMADLCGAELGQRPVGMWLAERVWEPDLPRVIAAAGYRYTLLDDSHLVAAGVSGRPSGWYATEKAGARTAILPIDKGLRYRIPFAEPGELFKYLWEARGETLTYGDDVEKFGLWLGTEKRVWKEGWLESFFEGIAERREWLKLLLPSEALRQPPTGTVYVPTISYAEMGAWALPAAAGEKLADLTHDLEKAGMGEAAAPYLRGGVWQSFLAKYPESRRIHRKMLRVSEKIEAARIRGDASWEAARDKLYQGQCNCAYWHGLFGGLYLQHLRSALMGALIEAEHLVDPAASPTATVVDHDADFSDEILLESSFANVYLSPARGGSAFEIDLRQPAYHLTDVLGRRREAYHRDVSRAQVIDEDDLDGVSAHDVIRATEEGLAERLRFDAYERGAFVDHLLPPGAGPEILDAPVYAPAIDLPRSSYEVLETKSGERASATLRLERDAVRVDKTVALEPDAGGGAIVARWHVSALGGAREHTFASEIAITLMSPDGEGRTITIDGDPSADPLPGATARHERVRSMRLVSVPDQVDVEIQLTPPAEVWRFPLETISQSEKGFERTYQGTVIAFAWRGTIGGGGVIEPEVRLRVTARR